MQKDNSRGSDDGSRPQEEQLTTERLPPVQAKTSGTPQKIPQVELDRDPAREPPYYLV
jgi:hypothetical protein